MNGRRRPERDSIIFGFDSAWSRNNRGAICAIGFEREGRARFVAPRPAAFDEALAFIREHRPGHRLSLVAIDQPTVVPNAGGSRPVDRVAGALVSRIGGGVQPANRGKAQLFGDEAPIWKFLRALGAEEAPLDARTADEGHFLIEVFPALALASLSGAPLERNAALKYNPANARKFSPEDWRRVTEILAEHAEGYGIAEMALWAMEMRAHPRPGKMHQDCIDAALCALVGLIWRAGPAEAAVMVGDTRTGYMVTPVTAATREVLEAAAARQGVTLHSPLS